MGRTIRTFTGAKARKYLGDLLAGGPGVSAEAADRIAAALEKEVVAIKVRPARASAAAGTPLLPFVDLPTLDVPASPATPDVDSDDVAVAGAETEPEVASAPAAIDTPFDPFAFSLVVVRTREGADGLRAKLSSIDSAGHLRALAKAQHVNVPAELASADDIRTAIIVATERRIADRKAAAS
ncbi:MAG: hypothetical protein ACT4N2_13670 [Hyphomicrobium sp.]